MRNEAVAGRAACRPITPSVQEILRRPAIEPQYPQWADGANGFLGWLYVVASGATSTVQQQAEATPVGIPD